MKRKTTDMIVIHCSATALGRDLGAADIDEMHRAKGWREIGYAQVIKRDGTIEFGRHYDDQGAHVKGHNKHTVGVALIGGLLANGDAGKEFFDTFNRSQEASLIETIKFLKLAYPGSKILGGRTVRAGENDTDPRVGAAGLGLSQRRLRSLGSGTGDRRAVSAGRPPCPRREGAASPVVRKCRGQRTLLAG